MAETLSASIVGRYLLGRRPDSLTEPCRILFPGQLLRIRPTDSARTRRRFSISTKVRSLATEVTRPPSEGRRKPPRVTETDYGYLCAPPNPADLPSLHNPRVRHERLGCGWLGVIFELDGVVFEHDPELEKQAWIALAQEEAKPPPPAFILRRIEGMKTEQAISEVLCWSRDPSEIRRLSARKHQIYRSIKRDFCTARPGSKELLNTLISHNIPMAIASTLPRQFVDEAIEFAGFRGFFSVSVAAEDVYRGKPDPEMFVYAAQLLGFIPERCIVFGNSNSTVEAAHDARMKCVAVASKHPIYELSAADLVVRRLDELSVVDLKNLADIDSPEFGNGELELEPEDELEPAASAVATDDIFW